MTDVIKPLSAQIVANTTANTVGLARLVRITNLGTPHALTTVTSGTVNTSVALLGGSYINIEKNPTDTITSNTTTSNVVATAVAYKN